MAHEAPALPDVPAPALPALCLHSPLPPAPPPLGQARDSVLLERVLRHLLAAFRAADGDGDGRVGVAAELPGLMAALGGGGAGPAPAAVERVLREYDVDSSGGRQEGGKGGLWAQQWRKSCEFEVGLG